MAFDHTINIEVRTNTNQYGEYDHHIVSRSIILDSYQDLKEMVTRIDEIVPIPLLENFITVAEDFPKKRAERDGLASDN